MNEKNSPPCGNDVFGCAQRADWRDWVHALRACKGCTRRAARRWGVNPADLSMVVVAFGVAKAGHEGAPPTDAEVWAVLEKAGVKREIYIPEAMRHAPADSVLPEGDRAAA